MRAEDQRQRRLRDEILSAGRARQDLYHVAVGYQIHFVSLEVSGRGRAIDRIENLLKLIRIDEPVLKCAERLSRFDYFEEIHGNDLAHDLTCDPINLLISSAPAITAERPPRWFQYRPVLVNCNRFELHHSPYKGLSMDYGIVSVNI